MIGETMKISSLFLFLFTPLVALAQDYDDHLLRTKFPTIEVRESRPSSIEGLVELVLTDGQVVYISQDGKRLLAGNLLDLETGSNLTEVRRDGLRMEMLASHKVKDLFEYPAADEKATVTVVTDIDCPYCRRLHQQVPDYGDLGISVRYLMMPRSGPETASFYKARNAACAADPAQALTRAMSGEELPAQECSDTIMQQFELARSLQTTGTPAMITESGRIWISPSKTQARTNR
jgi:thiol:disulfide interchange protein DsbC